MYIKKKKSDFQFNDFNLFYLHQEILIYLKNIFDLLFIYKKKTFKVTYLQWNNFYLHFLEKELLDAILFKEKVPTWL